MPCQGDVTLRVELSQAGQRLDTFITAHLDGHTRSFIASLIRQGHVHINGMASKPGTKLKPYQQIIIRIPPIKETGLVAEPVPLDILYEDDSIIVVNKKAGLVVHPAAGHYTGTLVHGLLHHCPDMKGIGGERRPGIVHRLDKDTSGVMVAAKNDQAHQGLASQFKARHIQKQYLALVYGIPKDDHGIIDLPIGRHPVDRKKMSTTGRGRAACTHWQVKERYCEAALLSVDLKTGRTHQIRVHCKSMGHPIIGDNVYGTRKSFHAAPKMLVLLKSVARQMLHAWQIAFTHPLTGKALFFQAPMPLDMADLIDGLRSLDLME